MKITSITQLFKWDLKYEISNYLNKTEYVIIKNIKKCLSCYSLIIKFNSRLETIVLNNFLFLFFFYVETIMQYTAIIILHLIHLLNWYV